MQRLTVLLATIVAAAILVTPISGQATVPTHYQLARPIPLSGIVQPQRGFPYGWTRKGKSPINHGVDFLNPTGTRVIAAADGTVYFAGGDHYRLFGTYPYLFLNLVIIQPNVAAPEGGD